MASRPTRLLITAGLVAGLPVASGLAQDRPSAAPPPPTDMAAEPGVDPEATFLSTSLGISLEEARGRRDIMSRIGALVQRAQAEDDSFAGVWVEQQPAFRIIVAFADQEDRQQFLQSLDPALRRYVQLRHVRAKAETERAELEEIFGALRGKGEDFTVSFNPKNQKYEVLVGEQANSQSVLSMVPPRLRSLVVVNRGPVPVDVQSNVSPGDRVHAGWDALTAEGYYACTFGFAGVNVNNRPAISTAGHCLAQQPKVTKSTDPGAYVTLPAPFAERQQDTYDFQLHEAVGLDPGYWVWFQNSKPVRGYESYVNYVPGYHSSGYFTVSAAAPYKINNGEHWVHRPVCKYGSRTGFTCGYISASYVYGEADGRPFSGMVRVNRSSQRIIAFSGDSGGPVFSPPNAQYDLVALGIMKSAQAHVNADGSARPCVNGTGYDCGYFYMPIDRIDHDGRIDLYTTLGLVRP